LKAFHFFCVDVSDELHGSRVMKDFYGANIKRMVAPKGNVRDGSPISTGS